MSAASHPVVTNYRGIDYSVRFSQSLSAFTPKHDTAEE